MKKLLVIALSLGLASGVSAQHGHFSGGYHYVGPRVNIVFGAFAPFYPYYGFYSPFYGYPYGGGYHNPSKLERKIQDIKSDYNDKIWSARHDTSLTGKQRRQTVRSLKHERDKKIDDLKMNYYKQ